MNPFRTGPSGLTPDVQNGGPSFDRRQTRLNRGLHGKVVSPIAERVWGAVQHRHDGRRIGLDRAKAIKPPWSVHEPDPA